MTEELITDLFVPWPVQGLSERNLRSLDVPTHDNAVDNPSGPDDLLELIANDRTEPHTRTRQHLTNYDEILALFDGVFPPEVTATELERLSQIAMEGIHPAMRNF